MVEMGVARVGNVGMWRGRRTGGMKGKCLERLTD